MSAANAKRWLILRTDSLMDYAGGEQIPAEHRPTFVHSSREAAESELLRLEAKFGCDFAIFEAVAYARQVRASVAPGVVLRAHIVEEIREQA
jgi:hypothetical protein